MKDFISISIEINFAFMVYLTLPYLVTWTPVTFDIEYFNKKIIFKLYYTLMTAHHYR